MTTNLNYRIFLATEGGETTGGETTTETHAETHHKNNFFYGDINEVIWGTVAFAIIFVLFLWKGLPPVKKAMATRSRKIEEQITHAETARQAADTELASLRSDLGNADTEAARIVAEAQERATRVRADLIARAEADVNESKTRARIEIEASKSQALADLREEVVAMTIKATEALVASNMTDTVQTDLVDRYIQQVGAGR
jgi:F-type H+-transporting ATPase subunit b